MQNFLRHSFSRNDRRRLATSIASTVRIESITCAGLFMVELYLIVFCVAYLVAIILNMLFLLLLLDESLITDKRNFHIALTIDFIVLLGLSIIEGLCRVFHASIVNRIIALLMFHLIICCRSSIICRLYPIVSTNLLHHFLVFFYSEILITYWWRLVSLNLFGY